MLQSVITEQNLPVLGIGIYGKRSTSTSLYHNSACEQFWTVPICLGANSSVELLLLALCPSLFHCMCSDLSCDSIVSLKSVHLLCFSSREGENWVWTVLLIYFLYPAITIPPPLQHNTRAASTRGRLTAGDLGVLGEILVAAKFYVLSPFYSQTDVLQVRMQELTCCKTAPSDPHSCQQSWIAT